MIHAGLKKIGILKNDARLKDTTITDSKEGPARYVLTSVWPRPILRGKSVRSELNMPSLFLNTNLYKFLKAQIM